MRGSGLGFWVRVRVARFWVRIVVRAKATDRVAKLWVRIMVRAKVRVGVRVRVRVYRCTPSTAHPLRALSSPVTRRA